MIGFEVVSHARAWGARRIRSLFRTVRTPKAKPGWGKNEHTCTQHPIKDKHNCPSPKNEILQRWLQIAFIIISKWWEIRNNQTNSKVIFKQGASRGAASGGSYFWKMAPPWFFLWFFWYVLWLSSRGLAGVLPPAGQIFEKWHLLDFFCDFFDMFCDFQAGV